MRFRACFCILIFVLLSQAVYADTYIRRLAPGVTLTEEVDRATPLLIHVLTVDLTVPSVHLGVGIGQDKISGTDSAKGREDVSRLARRHGALAAVNADFFPYTGDPLGIGILNGELFSEPWTGNGKGGPRPALGVLQDGRHVIFDTLGFLGDLQAADGQRAFISGIDRPVGIGETIVFTSLYGTVTANRQGGTDVVVHVLNLPVRANKLMVARVDLVNRNAAASETIPTDGVVLCAAPGAAADFLAAHMHPDDRIGFVMGVSSPGDVSSAVQVAQLPRTTGDLPSRDGLRINRKAFEWSGVQNAVGGGPQLLRQGEVVVPAEAVSEGFDPGFIDQPHPRTAVGTSADGTRMIIVTVDGRQAVSKGVSLVALAHILQRYGATEAMNFDGGGSTAMAVAGMIVNSPSGTGSERPVADMLLVYSDHPWVSLPKPSNGSNPISPSADNTSRYALRLPVGPVTVGSLTPIGITANGKPIHNVQNAALWQGTVGSDAGYVTQQGVFMALKPGTGAVAVTYKGQLLMGAVVVEGMPTPPVGSSTIQANFAPSSDGQNNYNQLTVKIVDSTGIARPMAPVHITVAGGVADATDTQTNQDGYVTIGVTWDSDTGGSVTITSNELLSLTLKRPEIAPK